MKGLRSIRGKRNAYFLSVEYRSELRRAIEYLWEVSLTRHQVEVSVVCSKICVHLNSTLRPSELDELAAKYSAVFNTRGPDLTGTEEIIDIRL